MRPGAVVRWGGGRRFGVGWPLLSGCHAGMKAAPPSRVALGTAPSPLRAGGAWSGVRAQRSARSRPSRPGVALPPHPLPRRQPPRGIAPNRVFYISRSCATRSRSSKSAKPRLLFVFAREASLNRHWLRGREKWGADFPEMFGTSLDANRQRIANLCPTAHRLLYVVSDRQRLAYPGARPVLPLGPPAASSVPPPV